MILGDFVGMHECDSPHLCEQVCALTCRFAFKHLAEGLEDPNTD
jgi:hypothetical protein